MNELSSAHHHPLPGREFRLALARHAGAASLATYTGLATVTATDSEASAAEQVATVRRETHDAVIMLSGDSRLTGVVWFIHAGDEALGFLRSMQAAEADAVDGAAYLPEGGVEADMDGLAAIITEHPRSVLIVATVLIDARAAAAAMS